MASIQNDSPEKRGGRGRGRAPGSRGDVLHAKGSLELAHALAGNSTIQEAARRAGISAATAHRRLLDHRFTDYVASLRAEASHAALQELRVGSLEAARELRMLIRDDEKQIRLQASDKLLRHFDSIQKSTNEAEARAELAELREMLERIQQAQEITHPSAAA